MVASLIRQAGRLRALAAALALASLCPSAALSQAFQTQAPHAILIDADSGTVLFEKAADDPTPPASMAKLMTVEILFNEITRGRVTLDTEFAISENAWRKGGGGAGGSSMFAQVNSRVKLGDLLRGIIVQSGNDASIAAAEGVAGTEDNFARLMNDRAKELGLSPRTVFRNSTGYSAPDQKATVRDLAKLSLHLIETYPELYKIFAEREFTWNKIRQQNRNPLLAMDMGADGLKTGYLEEAGYGLTASAVQGGQRLVLAVNGLKSARDRAAETRKLLDWGFRAFEARQLVEQGQSVGDAQVYGGDKRAVPLVAKRAVRVLAPRGSSDRLAAQIVYKGPLKAPIRQGAEVGRLRVMRGDVQALDIPVYAAEDVGVGSIPQRAVDGLFELGTGLIRGAFSKS